MWFSPLLFSLFLLLFMGSTELFGTIHGSHCTISTNFYLYLQYFQQKVFNFSKISDQTYPKRVMDRNSIRVIVVMIIMMGFVTLVLGPGGISSK